MMFPSSRPSGDDGVFWDGPLDQPAITGTLRELLTAFITEARASTPEHWNFDPRSIPAGREALELDRDEQALLACYLVTTFGEYGDPSGYFAKLRAVLLRRKLPFTEDMLVRMVGSFSVHSFRNIGPILSAVERHLETSGVSPEMLLALEAALAGHLNVRTTSADRSAARRIAALVWGGDPAAGLIRPGEPWRDYLLEVLPTAGSPVAKPWAALLERCANATSSRPSARWLGAVSTAIEGIGVDQHADILAGVLDRVATSVPDIISEYPGWDRVPSDLATEYEEHQNLLRGLVWSAAVNPDPVVLASAARAASRCYRKIPYHGPQNQKVGNACLWVFANCGRLEAISHLTELRRTARYKSSRDRIGGAIRDAAVAFGMSEDEIEEAATPTLGFMDAGRAEWTVDAYTALVDIESDGRVNLRWRNPKSKVTKSAPKALRESQPDLVKDIRSSVKRTQQTVAGVRDRLERLLMTNRTWKYSQWRQWYIDHPLVGPLARSLIWTVGETVPRATAWIDGAPTDQAGNPLPTPTDDDAIRLWHPVASEIDEITAWRTFFIDRTITQPVKQVHREVYLLTPAEHRTKLYSNRFAGHIIRQHQLRALCQTRGWEFSLIGAGFDSHNYPVLHLPRWDLSARFTADVVAEQTSAVGIYLYLTTNSIDFWRDDQQIPLADIDPIVFSEVMRDIDLFVSVASIGSDPTWNDGGPAGPFRVYWLDFVEQDLTASAKVRQELIKELIPRMGRSDTWHIDGNHLVVDGTRHRYRIHLGSGAVSIDPGRYLRIEPQNPRKTQQQDRIWLPFHGDQILTSVLSKALLLSNDDDLPDPTILGDSNGDNP